MHHEYHRWFSPSLGRDMELQIFGHAGAKLLVFPTSLGTHREWPDRRMHLVLRDHLDNGWLQMYTLDQVHGESWYDDTKHPGARAWRQLQYDEYVYREVIPLTYAKNRNDFIIATGASFGAYHAMTFGLRHPDVVRRIIGMSGKYDITFMTGGYVDQNVHVPALELTVEFARGEEMRTEISAKFRRAGVGSELGAAGLRLVDWWTDSREDFALSLSVRA